MKTVIIGIGSPVLTDGGAPLRIVGELRRRGRCGAQTGFITLPAGGFDLLSAVEGCAKAVVVAVFPGVSSHDATVIEEVITGVTDEPYAVSALPGDHGIEVAQILVLGRQCGYIVPDEVIVVKIIGATVHTVSDRQSAAVAGIIDRVTRRVEELAAQWDT